MNEALKIVISAEIANLKKNIKEAKGTVETFKNEINKHKDAIKESWNTMGEGAQTASKAIIGGVVAATTALVGTAAATQEYRNQIAQLNTAFESAGGSAEIAKNTYNDLYRVLGDGGQATEAAQHLAKLTTEEQSLAEWTNACQGIYATFGASLPIESLTEAANETAKVGTVTGSLADALNWAGISEDAFNEKLAACNTEAEREKLIRETLNSTYSEAAATYEKNNEAVLAQNEAQAKLQENLAIVGAAIVPVITAFTSFASEALALVTPYLQELADTYMPKLEEVLGKAKEKLEPIMELIVNNLPLIATIAGVILGIAAAYSVVNGVLGVYSTLKAAHTVITTVATAAQTAFAAANWAAIAPIMAVVAAIAVVIAIIVLFVKHWDTIKETTIKVVNIIKEKVLEMKDKVVSYFENLKSSITTKINDIKTKATDTFNKVKDAVIKPVEKARDKVKEVIDKIKGFFDFEWKLPKLKLPSIKITGEFSLSPPQVPKFSLNWNALGGVFDKPTVFGYGGSLQGIGEDGAEAVVPLENNLGWLDKLATMLSEKMGAGTPVVLTVDGKVFAQTTINTLNELTKQQGSLPLVIA